MFCITKITPTKKFGFNNIYINDVYSFTVCDLVLTQFKLKEKLELGTDIIEQILCSELTERFKSYSLNILGSRPRSEKEILKKLNERIVKYKESWPVFSFSSRHSRPDRESISNSKIDSHLRGNDSEDTSKTPITEDGPKIVNLKETVQDSSVSSQSTQNDRLCGRHIECSEAPYPTVHGEVSKISINFEDTAVNSIFQTAKDNTIEFLKKYNYLNNQDFADWLVAQRVNQGKGKLFIKQDMFKKGVSKEIIESTLKSTNFESSIKPVYEKALKKYAGEKDPYKKKQKIYRYLLSRGFSYDEINTVSEK